MPGINMMPSGSTLQIPLDACTNFSGKAGNAQVTLTWTDPKDKYATPEGETAQDPDQLVSVWEYTQIIRKTGSPPTGPHDGELVVSSSVRDQYATTGFVDDGLTNDTLYYYAAFAYNTDGVASEGAFTSATPMAGTPLAELAEGTLIKILENGSPVEFYLAKHNYEPTLNGEGRELVVRKDCYDNREWNEYYNTYAGSTIDNWLNGAYKSLFSAKMNSLMGTTQFYYTPKTVAGDNTVQTISRAIFLLSAQELNVRFASSNDEGSTLPISSTLRVAYLNGQVNTQWTRTPFTSINRQSIYANESGTGAGANCSTSKGSRPCFTLPSTALVDQDLNLIETAAQTTALSAA